MTQAVIMIMSFSSNFLATIAALFDKHATPSLKCGQLCLGGPDKKSHTVTFHSLPPTYYFFFQIEVVHVPLIIEIFTGTYLNRVTVQV